jgi:hypothetical protein
MCPHPSASRPGPRQPPAGPEVDAYRFRAEARIVLAKMIADAKSRLAPVKKVVRKTQRGCS